ncbi:MAG: protein usg [Devosia nanyangense]|uniref:Protein usg n=1 Tax=Devosia nanyangense TaxID=1228055 RepID=A0A933KXK3_9HYPH|nr:protein usg [Devosia nanyangense]
MQIPSPEANAGYGLTTAQIVYRIPDHLDLLQEFVWQRFDLFPEFPVLGKFLAFWEETIEGPIHSVTVAHARLIKPADLREMRRMLH